MLIVVEGVDASGKSTLLEASRAIKGKYFLLLRHSCRPLRGQHIRDLMLWIDRSDHDLVLDRHPLISEPIYGPILRGKNLVDDWSIQKFQIDTWLSEIDRIIYCRPPLDLVRDNLKNKPQLAGVEDHLTSLYNAYDLEMGRLKKMGIRVIPYDYSFDQSIDIKQLFFGEPQ